MSTQNLQPLPLTVPEMLIARMKRSPDAPLLRFETGERTSSEVVEAAARTGALLVDAGVKRGDRVAIMAGNRVELLDLILGCSWIGAVSVPINTASRGEQLRHILHNSEASLIVVEPELLSMILELDGSSPVERIWVLRAGAGDRETSFHAAHGRPEVSPVPLGTRTIPAIQSKLGDTTSILYTSGTTGVSKGVECPHGQFFWWGTNMADQLGIVEGDVLYTNLPLFHTNALNAFFQAVVADAVFVLGPKFSVSRFWTRLVESQATVTYLLGAMVTMLANQPHTDEERAHRVRTALAPATSPTMTESFKHRFGVQLLDGYGSTETNGVIGSTSTAWKSGMMGRLRPGFEVRIVDERGLDVPEGTPGELWVRSSQPFGIATGYFRMPEKTVESWQDLWFHTGDRIVLEPDGWYRFVDRIKDVIRRRGENISSAEVEAALRDHPSIADVAVYPVESELGEDEVMAAIIAKSPVTFEALEEFCRPRLAAFAIPRFVRFVEGFPQTENGKVRKAVLREEGRSAAAWDRDSLRRSAAVSA